MADYLTAAEAARRLGVKPATLYAYVSRGVLSRVRAPDGRTSLFGAEEVEQLARRGRPRRPAGVADITVESAITEITGDSLRFRGLDATRLAVSRTFEEVAELLWTGEFPSGGSPGGNPGGRGPRRWRRAGPRRPPCPPGHCPSSGSRSSSRPWRRPTPSGSSSTARP